MLQIMNKTNSISNFTKRFAVLTLLLLTFALGARAAEYVISYTNGGTTYYLARNGTTGVQRVTTFDPTTCIWSCSSNTAGTIAGTLNNSNTYGYLFQTVNDTRYFLSAQVEALALVTSASSNNNSFTRWRTNGTYVYNRYSNRLYYYIGLSNNDVARQTNQNNASRPYQVTFPPVSPTFTNPTINGNDVLTATGNYTYTASGAAYQAGGYVNYRFNNTDHYFDNNNTAITPEAATLNGTAWSISANEYATINSSGIVTVNKIPTSDITLTITATVTVSGGNPVAPAGTTLVGTKEITIQGSVPEAPTINVSGTTVTLQTDATGTTSIRYTIDGTNPTTTTGAVYSGAFDISGSTNSPVTIKAITVRNGNASSVTTQQVKLTLPEPVITVNAATGTATITCSNSSVTIYYTTDGSAPSATNGTSYNGQITGLATMATVKAIAICDGWNSSSVASATVEIPSGVSGGIVTLFDYEDHNWSYYQASEDLPDGYPDELHSPYPRNIKITYYGNGNTVSTSNDASPADNTFTASTNNTVKVGIDAPEHTFVYYKTLERDANNRFPYELIPNPFSVRPTYGTGDTRWRGFYKWRIKSITNGAVYNASGTQLGVGSMLNAEEIYHFQPTDYTLSNANNAISMEIELEALWARAYVGSGYQASVGYERNFVIGGAAVNYPATYSAIYPNGTTNGTTAATAVSGTYNAGTRTLSYDTKFEYINLNGGTYTANNHYLCFGRGISTNNNAGSVQGINGGASDLNYTLRVESGQFSAFAFVRSSSTTVSGRYIVKAIMGCDYDRATKTNDKLSVSPQSSLFFSTSVTYSNASNKDVKTFDCVFKSGSYQKGYWNDGDENGYQHVAYLGPNSAGNTYPGVRYVTVEGGEFAGMCGGRGVGNTSTGYMTPEVITFDLRIKGGIFHGSVFGGAADNPSIGSRRFILTGGEIQGWIAGGCNGTGGTNGTGATDGDSYIYVGGNALVGGDRAMYINGTNGGQVFGAGRGISGRTSSVNHSYVAIADEANISNNKNNNSYAVGGNMYGGSYNGIVAKVSNVYILGGTVKGKVFGGSYGNTTELPTAKITMTGGLVEDGVHGGSNSTGTVGDVTMQIDGGQVGTSSAPANIHGGGYGQNTVISGNVEVNIAGGTINGDIYGGSALGKVNTNTSNTTVVNLTGGIIHGDAYGGGLGDSETAADVNGNVTVTLNGTAFTLATTTDDKGNSIPISGRIFGCNNINGSPKGTVLVQVLSTVAKNGDGTSKDKPEKDSGIYELQAVYGGGNLAAYNPTNPKATGQYTYTFNSDTYGEVNFTAVEKPVQVVIDGCGLTSIEYVYGGGNAAATPATDVLVLGSYEIGNVFGGGNGKDRYTLDGGTTWNENNGADVGIIDAAAYAADHTKGLYGTGKSKASVLGGTVHNLFGASNTKGNVVSESLAYVDNANICDLNVGGIYGGGNEAYMDGDSKIELGCIEAMEEIYGGARNADVKGDINLTISSGHFDRVFGGNNIGGTINGSITVTIKETGCNPITIGELYGCGNQAPYTTPEGKHDPIINLISFTSIGNVFGGGFGEKAVVKGNPTVNIDVEEGDNSESDWAYNGQTITFSDGSKVTLPVHEKGEIGAIGTVYGGGNAAKVIGNTTVNMKNGIVENTLFGGGNAADVEGNTSVTILDGTIGGNVYGGGNAGDVTGATKVQIGEQPTP